MRSARQNESLFYLKNCIAKKGKIQEAIESKQTIAELKRVYGWENGKRNPGSQFFLKSGTIFEMFVERTVMIAFKCCT